MLQPRNILYFDPFYFKNGNTAKAKYFLVLKIIDVKVVIASLPTSKDHVPSYHPVSDGCIELPSVNFNCFVVSESTKITECEKCFPRKTFFYGQHIDDYDVKLMKELYPLENTNYIIWGKMKEDLFKNLICCFCN